MRDSFLTYRSTFEALRALPAEYLKEVYIMTGEYAMDGREPDQKDGIAYGLFCSIKPLIDSCNRKATNRNKTEQTRTEQNKPEQTGTNENKPCTKEERKKEKGEKENINKTRGRFSPPTMQELSDYITTHGYNVDAEKFLDYYTANGWHVGKNPMKDWKAAVRNWQRNQRQGMTANGTQGVTAKTTKFSNFPQREYDFDALEDQLLAAQGEDYGHEH